MRKREKRRRRGGSEMGEERGRGERVINRAVLERERERKERKRVVRGTRRHAS